MNATPPAEQYAANPELFFVVCAREAAGLANVNEMIATVATAQADVDRLTAATPRGCDESEQQP